MPRRSEPSSSSSPVRIYSYGCRPPTAGYELLDEQLELAHRYRNALVEVERQRRQRVAEAMRAVAGVGTASARVDELVAALDEARAAIRKKRSGAGRRADTRAETARAKVILAQLRDARAQLHAAKDEVRHDPLLQAQLRAIHDESCAQLRAARKKSGLYWGTYLRIEAAAEQARKGLRPPSFVAYDGSGKIAVQLQRGGLTVRELFGCQDSRLRIRPVPAESYRLPRHQRRLATRTMLWIRAGSGSDDDWRAPRWVELPLILHRPLPEDAIVKWAWVIRRTIGRFEEYELQLVTESATFRGPSAPVGSGTVAVGLGWRRTGDHALRAAYWRDDQARADELPLPAQERLLKPNELQSRRQKAFEAARETLRLWLAAREALPEWLGERTQSLAQWRAPGRLAALWQQWQRERVDGDAEIAEMLDEWATRDRRLHWWEANQRARTLGHRREEYRIFARRLAATYAVIVLEKLDLSALAKAKRPEAGVASEQRAARREARLAAPGELRDAIKEAARKTGAQIVEVDAAHVAATCSACGGHDAFATSRQQATCKHCARVWDQDDNACANLLRLASRRTNEERGNGAPELAGAERALGELQ